MITLIHHASIMNTHKADSCTQKRCTPGRDGLSEEKKKKWLLVCPVLSPITKQENVTPAELNDLRPNDEEKQKNAETPQHSTILTLGGWRRGKRPLPTQSRFHRPEIIITSASRKRVEEHCVHTSAKFRSTMGERASSNRGQKATTWIEKETGATKHSTLAPDKSYTYFAALRHELSTAKLLLPCPVPLIPLSSSVRLSCDLTCHFCFAKSVVSPQTLHQHRLHYPQGRKSRITGSAFVNPVISFSPPGRS